MLGAVKTYKLIADEMKDWFGIQLKTRQIRSLITLDTFDTIRKVGGVDTQDREMLISDISMLTVGKSWPLNGDSDEYTENFFRNFAEICQKRKIKWEGTKTYLPKLKS